MGEYLEQGTRTTIWTWVDVETTVATRIYEYPLGQSTPRNP